MGYPGGQVCTQCVDCYGPAQGMCCQLMTLLFFSTFALVLLPVGYLGLLGILKGHISTDLFFTILFFAMIGQGSGMANFIGLTTNLRNFGPKFRTRVTGVVKAMFGVGVVIFAMVFHFGFGSQNVENFFLFYAILFAIVGLLSLAIVRKVDFPFDGSEMFHVSSYREGRFGVLKTLVRNKLFWLFWLR